MVEIIRNFLILCADFINKLFDMQIEWQTGQSVPIGKVVLAFIYLAFTLYFIFDCMGLLDGGD